MGAFDHKTIQFEEGLCLAFSLIKKLFQINKHLKMKLIPFLETPKHRIMLILQGTLQKDLVITQRRRREEGSTFAQGGHM